MSSRRARRARKRRKRRTFAARSPGRAPAEAPRPSEIDEIDRLCGAISPLPKLLPWPPTGSGKTG